MQKHQESHRDSERKKCHYFNNQKTCPFDEIGCMFAHETSEMCRFNKICNNKLCPFQHTRNQYGNQNKIEENYLKGKEAEHFDFTDNFNEYKMEMEPSNFQTSTPKKRKNKCEDCANRSECVECIVKRWQMEHGGVTTALRTSTPGGLELGDFSCSTSGCSDGAVSSFA